MGSRIKIGYKATLLCGDRPRDAALISVGSPPVQRTPGLENRCSIHLQKLADNGAQFRNYMRSVSSCQPLLVIFWVICKVTFGDMGNEFLPETTN